MLRSLPAALPPVLLLSLFVPAGGALAQQSAGEATPVQRVEVKGPGVTAQRRDDVLGRIVVGRDELQRHADTGLAGVLARQPGLSVNGTEIRMRGLGAGYTQILIDGEPAPEGFAIGSLSPDLVERVEIQRSAQADTGTQAIAGSINIVLRKTGAPRRTARLAVGGGEGASNGTAALQWSGRAGAAAFGLGVTVDASQFRQQSVVDERTRDADGAALRRFAGETVDRVRKLSLAPRLDFKGADGDTLTWTALADVGHTPYGGSQHETTLQGASTASPDTDWHGVADTWLLKSDVSGAQRAGPGRLSVKAGMEANGRAIDYRFHGIDPAGEPWLNVGVVSSAREQRASASGKFVLPLAQGHNAAIGWDGAATRRAERRHQRNTGLDPAAPPTFDLDQDYAATVGRLAWFVQDEWTVSERLEAYLGLRREGLDTRTIGRDIAAAATASRVWSPVAQAVWKPFAGARDQVRIALARTYKAPQPRDLVPRRYTVNNDNGPASPDYQGNPLLRPEVAWGLDAALESYFARDGMASLSLYARRVRDVTLLRLWQEGATWVSSPVNAGNASVHGVEFDARVPLAPAVTLRANAARNWSRVDGMPGPDNHLDSQVPFTANLGVDLRGADGATAGANYRVVGGGRYASAQSLTVVTGAVRELEAYAGWRALGGQWKLTLSDLLHRSRHDARLYDDGATASSRATAAPHHAGLRLQLELPI